MRHTHLDQQRRDRDDDTCLACQLLWEAQEARVAPKSKATKAEKEIKDLVKREAALADRRYGNRAKER
jgi:hypothetical protein